VLEWLRLDADASTKADDALVFSDETGEPLGRFRTAWVTTVLKAHGIKPEWKSYNWTALTPECLAEFRRVNLRWHDLRHEYASRLVEKNVPLAQVRDLLGHASIMTTERYDNQKLENLQAAAARLERGETFDPAPQDPIAMSICQDSVKNSVDDEADNHIDRVRETSPNYQDDLDLENWLGGRDSNPDTVVQSHVSYRWTTSQYGVAGRDELPIIFAASESKQESSWKAQHLPGCCADPTGIEFAPGPKTGAGAHREDRRGGLPPDGTARGRHSRARKLSRRDQLAATSCRR
jgi:Phage integrase family